MASIPRRPSRRQFLRTLGSGAAALPSWRPAVASPPAADPALDPLLDRFYPTGAWLVPVAQRAQLQSLLDQHGTIRLEAGDYRGLAALVLSSGQRIHGPGMGCVLPPVEVAAGCTGALLSGVVTELRFRQPGASVHGNVFRRVTYGNVLVDGATLEDNLFLDKYLGRWSIDNSLQGFMARNRIVRTTCQQPEDAFIWKGDPQGASTGNAVLWANHLTPPRAKFVLSDLPDLRILNYDCEAPGSNGSPAIDARSVGRLHVFATTGTNRSGAAVRVASGAAWLHQSRLYNQDVTGVTLDLAGARAAARTLFEPQRTVVSPNGGVLLSAFSTGSDVPGATTSPADLNVAQRADLTALVAPPLQRPYVRPALRAVPPAAPSGPVSPMGRSQIQALLDLQGMVVLDPGVYVLDGPLVMGPRCGLVGSGMDQTYLVAANANIDLIVDAHEPPPPGSDTSQSRLLLAELTLQGGRRGIHHSLPPPADFKLLFTNCVVSHVCIRDAAEAGWMFEELFGYDNNCFEQVLFVNCPVGLRQLATHDGTEATQPRLAYMDKNVFFRCQWQGCGRALALTAIRASGGNMWFECGFKGSTEFVARARNHDLLFVGCDFDANEGDPLLSTNGHLMVVASRWRAASIRPTSFADSLVDVTLEGCELSAVVAGTPITNGAGTGFDLANSANRAAYANRRFHLFHNRAEQVSLNGIPHAVLLNNDVGAVPETARWAYRIAGVTQVLDATPPAPGSRLMGLA